MPHCEFCAKCLVCSQKLIYLQRCTNETAAMIFIKYFVLQGIRNWILIAFENHVCSLPENWETHFNLNWNSTQSKKNSCVQNDSIMNVNVPLIENKAWPCFHIPQATQRNFFTFLLQTIILSTNTLVFSSWTRKTRMQQWPTAWITWQRKVRW